jgi:hypothetical protein
MENKQLGISDDSYSDSDFIQEDFADIHNEQGTYK